MSHRLTISAQGTAGGNLALAQAHWVTQNTIAWKVLAPAQSTTFQLHYDPTGAMRLEPGGIAGGGRITLQYEPGGLPSSITSKFPHLSGYVSLTLPQAELPKVPDILKGQIAVSATDKDGRLIDTTALQIPGVLDDLYTYTGPLGVTYDGDIPTLRVWAPTARAVTLHLFDDSKTSRDTAIPMTWEKTTGVWSLTGAAEWTGKFYLYEVEVFVHATRRVQKNLVTDPYSLSLSINSRRSQIVNLADHGLMPEGWESLSKPPLDAPEDIVLYELHVRDFSIHDETVPAEERGTFKAFTRLDSNGMKHLAALADAGLTHIHLLPVFDIATIEEDKSRWAAVDEALLRTYAPDSSEQQAAVGAIRGRDGFNWGYDPYHYTVPEGSYATHPDGSARILEFRQMVQALSRSGLRVVMDVVYNHTHASGQNDMSVLDKVVPGYYQRLNGDGLVETSTCCQNTATEHAMMEKLMIDSLVTWATAYKVDGFRFDLMGHHMLSNMAHVRQALDALTLEKVGVDGSKIYVYGEGWNFGEVANNARGKNATQLNLGGLGIGSFNDRLRDGVRGGGPFTGRHEQGFATGLFDDPNATDQGSAEAQRSRLLRYTDWIRVGLAGNLRDYPLVNAAGRPVTGAEIDYNGAPAGYTLDPQENIVYVSAHDNETLFDAVQAKAPARASLADRVRMHNLSLSLVMLSQGVPFYQAGDDMLRSKSMDRDSFDSGDWFNRLDFTYETNNWGVGLPLADKNQALWSTMAPLLADTKLKPGRSDILNAVAHFREMLQIRQSSPLFRLRTAEEVTAHLTFLNTGPEQIPGLIVMRLTDSGKIDLDPNYDQILVAFNATRLEQTFAEVSWKGAAFELHPVQAASNDPVVRQSRFDASAGAFTVPGRTTAVFVSAATAVEPTAIAQPTATAPIKPTAPIAPTAAPTTSPVASAVPSTGPSTASPEWSWLALGGVLLSAVAGFFLWRRRAAAK